MSVSCGHRTMTAKPLCKGAASRQPPTSKLPPGIVSRSAASPGFFVGTAGGGLARVASSCPSLRQHLAFSQALSSGTGNFVRHRLCAVPTVVFAEEFSHGDSDHRRASAHRRGACRGGAAAAFGRWRPWYRRWRRLRPFRVSDRSRTGQCAHTLDRHAWRRIFRIQPCAGHHRQPDFGSTLGDRYRRASRSDNTGCSGGTWRQRARPAEPDAAQCASRTSCRTCTTCVELRFDRNEGRAGFPALSFCLCTALFALPESTNSP